MCADGVSAFGTDVLAVRRHDGYFRGQKEGLLAVTAMASPLELAADVDVGSDFSRTFEAEVPARPVLHFPNISKAVLNQGSLG